MTWKKPGYSITDDRRRVKLDAVHAFLTTAYWSPGIPKSVVKRAIRGSLPFSVFHGRKQVGFARVISDFATYAYLADVYILESYRGRGLSKWMMKCILSHPRLQGLRRWTLATRDAHGLYAQYGFQPAPPERFMEILRRDVYSRKTSRTV